MPSETMEQLRLLVSEVVTNAVRHSGVGPDGCVGLRVADSPGSVRVEVSDPGPGLGVRSPYPDPNSGSGYGLCLVQELADRWGTGSEGEHTSVWFEIGYGDHK